MEYAMNQPWWAVMNEEAAPQGRERRRGKRRGRDERPDEGPARPRGRFGGRMDPGPEAPFRRRPRKSEAAT